MLLNTRSPHGGDIYQNRAEHDFSANINPFGMPPQVREALMAAVGQSVLYPDPYCTVLRRAIAGAEGVPEGAVLCGNGAAELVYSFAYALPGGKPALVVSPTFSEYETALKAAGAGAERFFLRREEGFCPGRELLALDFSRYSAVFVCSPNNPTGVMMDKALLEALAEKCAGAGTRLFCDFCFLDLSDEPDAYDLPELTAAFPEVFVLKAFTKSYGLAGIRLGYGLCTDGDFLTRMSQKAPCWNVSTPAQQAGIAALSAPEWVEKARAVLLPQRKLMRQALLAEGVQALDGRANFLLLRSELPLYERLLVRGFLTRNCGNYPGLDGHDLRIAVKAPAENALLLGAIRECIHEKS